MNQARYHRGLSERCLEITRHRAIRARPVSCGRPQLDIANWRIM
jgi:hypothetical protein